MASVTLLPNVSPTTTSATTASGSCSACASSSAARCSGSADSSAMISSSLGPAGESIATTFATNNFACATYAFPGPTMRSTRGMRRGAVGHRGDRASTTDGEHAVRPRQLGRRKRRRCRLAR